jgi:hypothetical protein
VVVLGLGDALGDLHVRVELHVLVILGPCIPNSPNVPMVRSTFGVGGRGVLAAVTAGGGGEQERAQQGRG